MIFVLGKTSLVFTLQRVCYSSAWEVSYSRESQHHVLSDLPRTHLVAAAGAHMTAGFPVRILCPQLMKLNDG